MSLMFSGSQIGPQKYLFVSLLMNSQVRASGYGGWFLLRLSLHDPVLPLNVEVSTPLPKDQQSEVSELRSRTCKYFILWQAPSKEDAVKLGLAVLAAVNEFPALDASALTNFAQQS